MDLFDFSAVVWLAGGLIVAWAVARLAARRGAAVAGFEAVVLGLIAGPYGQDVLNEAALAALSPAASFALGALGLGAGLRLRIDDFRARERGALRISVLVAVVTVAFVGTTAWALLEGTASASAVGAAVAVLTAAALLAAPRSVEAVIERHGSSGRLTGLVQAAARYSEVLGVVAFGLLLCVFHVGETSVAGGRPLVAVEWFALAVLAGVIVGLLFSWYLGRDAEEPLAVTLLGMVLFASGVATALNLSPLMVCLLVGAVVANTSPASDALSRAVRGIEGPMLAVVVFFAAGAWRVPPMAAWVLVTAYLGARAGARWVGGRLATMASSDEESTSLDGVSASLLGQGGLVVAIALNAWQVYDDALASTVLTCLLVGGFINEIPSRWLVRRALVDAGEVPLREAA